MSIGKQIKKARMEAGYSQEDIVEFTGISIRVLHHLEAGKPVNEVVVDRVLFALGIELPRLELVPK